MYQKVCRTCKVVALHNKPIASLKFSLPSPSSSLKLVIGCYLGLHWTHNAIQHIKCAKKEFLSESRVVSSAHAWLRPQWRQDETKILICIIRDRKQQWRRHLRKGHLKSQVALLQTLSHLFHLARFVKCWQIFLELNCTRLYRSSGKEKEGREGSRPTQNVK